MERKCKQCNQTKDIEEFPRYVSRGVHGHRHTCRTCWSERWNPVWKEHMNRYYNTNHAGIRDKTKERSAKAYRNDKQKAYQRNERYEQKYPEKQEARNLVKAAVRSGKLIKLPCEVCGDLHTQAHHEDYSKPLEVRWLCRYHHGERHRQINRERHGA